MMNKTRIIAVVLLICMLVTAFAGCDTTPKTTPAATQTAGTPVETTSTATPETPASTRTPEFIDYASSLKLDTSATDSLKQKATVKAYIDGDTTHFNVPTTVVPSGVLKARYLAINTPESTGKIEEWGKAASKFTKEKLLSASSIIIESDDGNWNVDSTGSRYLVWIWYRTNENEEYRNLNIEILQNGLAIASNSANNRYGTTAMAAINQARAFALKIYSDDKDPDFPYGEAQEVTLKELRSNIENYDNAKVAFEGVITRDYSNGVYIEDYDEETEMYYGIYIYYGFSASGDILKILKPGNRARIVGTVTYYETGGTYQVSGLTYRAIKPDDPGNTKLISEGNEAGYLKTDPAKFASGTVEITAEDETKKTLPYASLAMATTLSMDNLVVKSTYTTSNEESSNKGAMTLTCECNGISIDVRTAVLYDESGKLVTASAYEGKIINVKGIVDYYDGTHQIKVFSANDITIK